MKPKNEVIINGNNRARKAFQGRKKNVRSIAIVFDDKNAIRYQRNLPCKGKFRIERIGVSDPMKIQDVKIEIGENGILLDTEANFNRFVDVVPMILSHHSGKEVDLKQFLTKGHTKFLFGTEDVSSWELLLRDGYYVIFGTINGNLNDLEAKGMSLVEVKSEDCVEDSNRKIAGRKMTKREKDMRMLIKTAHDLDYSSEIEVCKIAIVGGNLLFIEPKTNGFIGIDVVRTPKITFKKTS